MHGIDRIRPRLKVTDIEVGETVVDEAVHGPIRAVHVLVDQPRDEIRGEGNHKGLGTGNQLVLQNGATQLALLVRCGLTLTMTASLLRPLRRLYQIPAERQHTGVKTAASTGVTFGLTLLW